MSKNKNNTTEKVEDNIVERPQDTIQTISITPIIDTQFANLYGGTSLVIKAHIETITNYCEAMSPGVPMDNTRGCQYQTSLYNALIGIISAENVTDMVQGMDAVMTLFRQEAFGALNPSYALRFMEKWMVEDNVRDTFCALITVLSAYADPTRRGKYGKLMRISGDNNVFIHLSPEVSDRLVQYLTRYDS